MSLTRTYWSLPAVIALTLAAPDAGRFELKGIAEPMTLYEASRST